MASPSPRRPSDGEWAEVERGELGDAIAQIKSRVRSLCARLQQSELDEEAAATTMAAAQLDPRRQPGPRRQPDPRRRPDTRQQPESRREPREETPPRRRRSPASQHQASQVQASPRQASSRQASPRQADSSSQKLLQPRCVLDLGGALAATCKKGLALVMLDDGRTIVVAPASHLRDYWSLCFAPASPRFIRLYVTDVKQNSIVKLSVQSLQSGPCEVRAVAGSGKRGFRDGSFGTAQFNSPKGLLLVDEQTVLLADEGNHCVRLLCMPDKVVRTVAGGSRGANGRMERGLRDGRAAAALFDRPCALAMPGEPTRRPGRPRRLFICDAGNGCVRSLLGKRVSTACAGFRAPTDIAVCGGGSRSHGRSHGGSHGGSHGLAEPWLLVADADAVHVLGVRADGAPGLERLRSVSVAAGPGARPHGLCVGRDRVFCASLLDNCVGPLGPLGPALPGLRGLGGGEGGEGEEDVEEVEEEVEEVEEVEEMEEVEEEGSGTTRRSRRRGGRTTHSVGPDGGALARGALARGAGSTAPAEAGAAKEAVSPGLTSAVLAARPSKANELPQAAAGKGKSLAPRLQVPVDVVLEGEREGEAEAEVEESPVVKHHPFFRERQRKSALRQVR